MCALLWSRFTTWLSARNEDSFFCISCLSTRFMQDRSSAWHRRQSSVVFRLVGYIFEPMRIR